MLLEKFHSNPKKATRPAMAFLCIGLALGVLGTTWTRNSIGLAFSPNWSDFARGFFIGLGITMECFAIVLLSASRKRSQ